MSKDYVFYLVLIILCSCNSDKVVNENLNSYEYQLNIKSDILEIPLDSVSNFSPYYFQYIFDDAIEKEMLYVQNSNVNSIDIYDLSKTSLISRIKINSLGEFINNLHGFYVINTDSILVYERFKLSPILLLELESNQLKNVSEFASVNPRDQSYIFNHGSMTASPTIFNNGKIYFGEFPFNIKFTKEVFSSGYALEMIYDIENDSTYFTELTWPKVYHQLKWDDFFLFCKTIDWKDRLIYSFEANDNIYIRDKDSLYSVEASSMYFDENITKTVLENEFSRVANNHYTMILADPFRKVYYRFAIHRMPERDKLGRRNTPFDQEISIIIMDSTFQKIGEKVLPGGKYLYKDSFVGKDGLYISNHNAKNYENLGEDVMSFSALELTKNE
jgi:hypothetical protein